MTALRLSVLAGLLMLAGLLVLMIVFVPRSPSPTGPLAVGRIDVTLRGSDGRLMPVTVWYPQSATAPAPLILYSPGWGGTRANSSIQVENLASYGFVVVGCNDIASDPATDPDHGVSIELQSDAALKATLERADRHVVLQANRMLDVLRALEDGQVPGLAGRLDLGRVGAMGYSVGGAAAIQAGLIDHRIRAVLNIDGALSGPPADQIGPQAYLLLSSREAFPTEAEQNSPDPVVRNDAHISAIDIPRNQKRMEQPDNYWVAMGWAMHDDMADGLFELRRNQLFRTNARRAAMNEAIGRLEVAYFRATLLGDDGALRALVGKDGQSVRWVSPTSATPGTANAKQ
jgi:dienelactone hydrolase